MRITGGALKNRIITCPKGVIRPAMDRMRESVFSILGNIQGSSFLDLFSGSGICALEAASRGAFPIVLVEKDAIKFPTILKNVLISPKRIECKRMAVELYIRRNKEAFDIIYIDPPFRYKFHSHLLKDISSSSSVKKGSIILLHHSKESVIDAIEELEKIDERHYGGSIVDFYKKSSESFGI